MTNNQLTPENVTRYAHYGADMMEWPDGGYVKYEDYAALAAELQERRKADSEPVAWTWHHLKQWHVTNDEERVGDLVWDGVKVELLYLHAQPAPVVPDERAAFNAWNNEDNLPIAGVSAKNAAWLAWQARAELAGNSPVIQDGLIAAVNRLLDSDGSRGCYSAIQCGDAHDEIERLLAAAPQEVPDEK